MVRRARDCKVASLYFCPPASLSSLRLSSFFAVAADDSIVLLCFIAGSSTVHVCKPAHPAFCRARDSAGRVIAREEEPYQEDLVQRWWNVHDAAFGPEVCDSDGGLSFCM